MFIKEIVHLDTQGKFIPAVQLSDYDSPQDNLRLVKSYIFANYVPDTHNVQAHIVGSIDLLRKLRLSYINASANRFVVIANYGHGKSHLALVLANYFGKPYQSPEVKEVLKRIELPLQNNLPEAENFVEFKRQYDRFLVIRLRGDVPRSLREQFFPALRKALQEHPETANINLPFWHDEAIKWLKSKMDNPQAQEFLRGIGTDFPNLLHEVEENKLEAYEQYVQLFAHLNNGVRPNAESNFSLREAVLWVTDQLCGENKPFAGTLVLFDEFSQLIERYSQSNAIGDLQDLLQGIGDRKGKALFLAFSPLDPDEVADRIQSGQALQNIRRELGRIDQKYLLYSLMESVLSASINVSKTAWQEFLRENPGYRGQIYGQVAEYVWDLYNRRYDKELHWTNEKFREVVIEGCFPLHPLTTAVLCHLKMQQGLGEDARTILKFVREQIEFKLNEPVTKDGKVNWILPIHIADYFGKRIASEQLYLAYEKAIENLEQTFGDDVTQAQYDVLRALLLQMADGLHAVTSGKQVELISYMVGLDFETTKKILRDLSEHSITRFDTTNNFNSFWPIAVNPQALEQKVKEHIGDRIFGEEDLYLLNTKLSELYPGAEKIEVIVNWGTPSDWAARTSIVTHQAFTPDYLKKLIKPYQTSFQGIQEGDRGLVVWLLALDESDIEFFKEKASEILNTAFPGETPPPVLIVLPSQPVKAVTDQFMRYLALEKIGRDPDAIKEIGPTVFANEVDRTKKALRKALAQLFGHEENFTILSRNIATLVVPQPYKAILLAIKSVNIQDVLLRLYEIAYPYRPPEFFTDLSRGSNKLRDAVKTVAKNLLYNRVGTALSGMTTLARDRLCKQNLMSKWQLLSTTYYIQEPEVLSLKYAWDYLESQIQPNDQEIFVRDFLPKLLNPPFGFDFNTATLLFTAWIGQHNNELRFYSKGRSVGIDFIEKLLEEKTPQDFLGKICVEEALAIARRDVDKTLAQGRALVAQIQKGETHSQREAEEVIQSLTEIVNTGICTENEKEIFCQAIADLQTSLDMARQYDQKANKLLLAIAGENDIRKLLNHLNTLRQMPNLGIVASTQLSVVDIRKKLEDQIRKAVEESCKKAVSITRIESADASKNALEDLKKLLQHEGISEYEEQIVEAEKKLEERVNQIKAAAEEVSLRSQISAMTAKADLSKLYEYRDALNKMSSVIPAIALIREQKLQEINRAISELETFAKSALQVYQTIPVNQAEELREKILRTISQYAGSEYETQLNQALEYLKNLQSFALAVREIERLPLHIPEDVVRIKAQINEIVNKYEPLLHSTCKIIIEKAQSDFENRIQSEYENSERKISCLEQQISILSSDKIETTLTQISAFTTEKQKLRIDKIRDMLEQKKAKERLEKIEKETQDVIERIEQLFLSIPDTSKRQECLERLMRKISVEI